MTASIAEMESVWDAHTAAEFITTDVEATMATMTADPLVLHVPTMVGARGREQVRQFYTDHFIKHQVADLKLEVLSRTSSLDRVVDEMVISFTHDVVIHWILQDVAPTGRPVTVPLVAVIGMTDGLVESEHIYWDQASVLAQIGWSHVICRPPYRSRQDLSPTTWPHHFGIWASGRAPE